MMWAYLAFVLIGTAAVQADSCPNVAVMPGFVMSKYVRKWYEIQRNEPGAQFGGTCVSVEYSIGENGAVTVKRESTNGHPSSLKGNVSQDKNEPAKLTIEIPSLKITSHYWILGTDYNSWAVMWRCENGVQSIWVLARDLNPSNSVLQKAYAVLDRQKINRSSLANIDRANCV